MLMLAYASLIAHFFVDNLIRFTAYTKVIFEILNLIELPNILFVFLFRPENLHPDACEKAKNRKRFNPKKSSVMEVMLEQEKGKFFPDMSGRDEQGFLPQTDPEHEFDGTKGPGKIANYEAQAQ